MAFDIPFIHAFHRHKEKEDEIYQVSTITALLDGIYEGETTFAELARHGNCGLGTLNALDGEMVALDGKFYQINSEGAVREIGAKEKTPFAVIIPFHPHLSLQSTTAMNWEDFQSRMDKEIVSTNLFYAFRAHGKFSRMKTRSVAAQKKPYTGLGDAAKSQNVFELRNVSGTIIGFRFPNYTQALNVAGYHAHFLTDTRDAGGHILDFTMEGGKIEIDPTSGFHMELPHGGDFLKASLPADPSDAVRAAENNPQS